MSLPQSSLNIILVYFVYGLAFFCMGLVMALESRRSPVLAEARVLLPLAVFGFVHGVHEWLEMFLQAGVWLNLSTAPVTAWIRLGLLVVSFSALILFGLTSLQPEEKRLPPWNISIGVGLLLAYLAVVVLTILFSPPSPLHWLEHADALARYLLAVPGAVLAAVALGRQSRRARRAGRTSLAFGLGMAAGSFALYGLTQLVVPAVDFFPARYLNSALFLGWTGIPIQAVRAALAVLVIVGLTRAIQGADHERQDVLAAAQEARLEALQQIQRDLEEKETLRRELLRHTVIAQEEERARIARELHDETAQYLTALTLDLATLRDSLPREQRVDTLLTRLQSLSRQMAQGIYRLVGDLRPAQLDDLGLGAAMQYLVDEARRSSAVEVFIKIIGSCQRLDPLVETVLFRVAQEAVANVARHACCAQAWLELEFGTEDVALRIRDKGQGFDPGERLLPPRGWGIAGMRERVEAVGGLLHIRSAPGEGTLVEANIPLPEAGWREIEENEREFDPVNVG